MIRRAILLLFSFVFLYTPSFAFVPIEIDICIYLCMALLSFSVLSEIFGFTKVPGVQKSFVCMIFIFIYTIFITIISPPSNVEFMDLNTVRVLRLMIEVVVFPYILVKLFVKTGKSSKYIIWAVICLAIIQSYISVLMMFVPAFKDFVTNNILQFSSYSKLTSESLLTDRVFGIGSEYLFGLPLFQAMMACVYMSLCKKKGLYFLFNLICLICSAVFCARTSLFILGGYFVYYFYGYIKKNFFVGSFLFVIVSFIVWYTYEYLSSVDDVVAIAHFNKAFDGNYGGYDMLFDSMLFFPDDIITWLFGDGSYAFFSKNNSDIGYVNDIFYGGLLYLGLEILSLYYLFKNANRKKSILINVLPFMFVIMFVLHYKGSIYNNSNFLKGVMLLYYAIFVTKDTCIKPLKLVNNHK